VISELIVSRKTMTLEEASPQFVSRQDILVAFRSDVPKYILPPDVRTKFAGSVESLVQSLSSQSLRQRRTELRSKLNAIFTNVLRGNFEPPLSAYLREQSPEITSFYIDRVNEIEILLTKALHVKSDPIPRPASWNEFWLKLFTERF
jgi:hypothetical protein